MKDNMDALLENAYIPKYEPSEELNKAILEKACEIEQKTKKGFAGQLPKVAAVVLALGLATPIGVYATNYLIQNVFVTEHGISVGEAELVDDAELTQTGEEAKIEVLSDVEGGSEDKWIRKEVKQIDNFTSTYYTFEDYSVALAESGMDNWLSKEYEDDNCVTYVHTQAADWEDHELSVFFYFGEKQFSMTQMLRPGVDHTQGVHSLVLQNTSNKRTYTSKNGYEFVLVDEVREDEMGKITKTYVMISYGEYLGYFSFPEFTDDEIHQILDSVVIPNE